ncbi:hypothetical protein [Kitasatospora sp. NBC_01302]|uniref:hypothetical protein n=1 Tax=Kitasatospora sp. NBC_01302 TaxID=2903575 RepID=UPI002E156E02|nr:hypothetical protein OG294_23135 [Kitasatospora sp. NBC_01302]
MPSVLVYFLILVSLALALRASRATRAAKQAAASAAQAQRLVAELTAAATPAPVSLGKPRTPGRAELRAVLYTDLVQVLGRRAAAELSSRPAPVDAVPAPVDAVPWSARSWS